MIRLQSVAERRQLVRVALGEEPADLIIRGGRLLNTNTREIHSADIAVAGSWIAAVGNVNRCHGPSTSVINAEECFLLPGFMDAHFHVESSMLTVKELSRLLLPRGITVITEDPHEIANVLGVEGIDAILNESHGMPLKVYLRVPPQVPGNPGLETSGAEFSDEDITELLGRPETISLAGDCSPYHVIDANPRHLTRITKALESRLTVNGQLPDMAAHLSNAFAAGGPQDSHIASSFAEVLMQLRLGLKVIINDMPFQFPDEEFEKLAQAISSGTIDSRHLLFCVADVAPNVIQERGTIDAAIRRAIAFGVDPPVAVQMGTLNTAEHYGVSHLHGSLTPGRVADVLFVDNLEQISIRRVVADGRLIAVEGQLVIELPEPVYPASMRRTVNLPKPLRPSDFVIEAPPDTPDGSQVAIRVLYPGSSRGGTLLPGTGKEERHLLTTAVAGECLPDPEQDIALAAVVNRYGANLAIGRAFVQGFLLARGAIAQTVNHDTHNIVVLGTNTGDMATAANHLVAIQGGIALAADGQVIRSLALPIGGLMSDQPAEVVIAEFNALIDSLVNRLGLGLPTPQPFIFLQTFALANIPALGLTDMGLVDVAQKRVIDPVVGTPV